MLQQSELPEGWVISELGEIISILSGKYLKSSEYSKNGDKPYPVAGAGGPIGWTNNYNFSPPILTLGRVGAAGSLNVYDSNAWVTDNTLVIQPHSPDFFKWLVYFFQTIDWSSIHTGSTQPLITQKIVKTLTIHIPPLPEQHRIVSAIEALFARLDVANERLNRVPDILKKFRQSVLAAACDGRLTEGWQDENENIENAEKIVEIIRKEKNVIQKKNQIDNNSFLIPYEVPNSWSWTNIECISKSMKNGIYKKQEFYSDNGIACLRMYNIEDGMIVWKNIKRMNLSNDEIANYLLEPGDILVNRVNSRELVGKAAPIPDDIEPCIYESKNIRLKIFNQLILSKYVGYWFQVYAQNYFNVNAQQTVNMASINQQQLGSMPFPLPSLPEQHEIVRRVDALFALADSIEAKVAAAREKTEKLRESILAKAFSGKLVETEAELARQEGRDYEPADVLLERIKAEHGKSGEKGKAAKGKSTHLKKL